MFGYDLSCYCLGVPLQKFSPYVLEGFGRKVVSSYLSLHQLPALPWRREAPVTGEENDVKDSESVRSEEAMPKINLVVPRRFKIERPIRIWVGKKIGEDSKI